MEREFLTVSALTKYIKLKFDKDRYLVDVPLKAEIAEINCRRGNYYVRLKDEHALISGVIFAQYETPVVKTLEAGSEVIIIGDVSVYEKTGAYQIYIHEVELFGQGDLYLAFEQLKQKLLTAGYFELEHKKAIPAMPRKIILISAPGSAALQDMLITLQKRYPLVELTVLPAAVQGAKAVSELIKQLKAADAMQADVVVLARGGGSYEDLQAFNDETLALTIFNMKTPVVSGIGHETDVTIADFVADLRAATPTAAIERITPDKADMAALITTYQQRLAQSFRLLLRRHVLLVQEQQRRLLAKSPDVILKKEQLALQQMWQRLGSSFLQLKIIGERKELLHSKQRALSEAMARKLLQAQEELKQKQIHLEALSPFDVLLRGYSITQQNGKVITSVKQVKTAEMVEVLVSDGTLVCNVEEIRNDKEKAII